MKREIAKGAAWMVLVKLSERSLGIVSTVILARLLVPADFGLIAMAMSVIGVIELISSFGFEVALIQKELPERRHYDTAWTLNVLLGTACAAGIALLSYPAAAFYGDDRLVPVMLVLAATWFAMSFENIGTVDFRRDMRFSKEFAFLTSKKVAGFVVTVTIAFAFQTYWALVAGMVAGRATGLALSYLMSPYRPRFTLAASGELFSFSGWLLASNVLTVAVGKLPHFAVGRLHGPQALGLYAVGSEIAHLPQNELIAPINRAVFPGYARMAGDRDALRRGFIDVIAVVFALALPASVGVAVIAEPLVRVALGTKWLDAVPVLQVLAVCGAIAAVTSNNVSVYLAIGKPGISALILLVRLITLVPLLPLLSSEFGFVGVAYAELAATTGSLAVSFPALFRALSLPVRTYAASLWRPVMAASAMGIAVHALLHGIGSGTTPFWPLLQLAAAVPAGVFAYAIGLWVLWTLSGRPVGAETFLLARLAAVMGMVLRLRPQARQRG